MSRSSLPPLEDDFARALLGSAEADAPSHAAYAKVATALGIGVGLGVGASSLPAAPAAVAVGAAGIAGVTRWSSSLGAKLALLGASGMAFVAAGALLLGGSHSVAPAPIGPVPGAQAARAAGAPALAVAAPPREPQPTGTRLVPADGRLVPALASPPVAGSAAAKASEPALPTAALRPLVAAVPPPARRVAHAPPARVSSGSSLAEQVQSLDRARVALAAGDSSSALAEISRYRAAWPDGVFLTEASVLEIEALAARGERSLARARAADFVAAHPDSPQTSRLRRLIPTQTH